MHSTEQFFTHYWEAENNRLYLQAWSSWGNHIFRYVLVCHSS